MFNYFANANTLFIQDLKRDMVWTRGVFTFRNDNRQGHFVANVGFDNRFVLYMQDQNRYDDIQRGEVRKIF